MSARTFAEEFWDLYQSRCRPAIEGACRSHLRRTGSHAVDLDDMVSWVDCRVWRLVRDRSSGILESALTAEDAADRIARASGMLARWAHLALVRRGIRRSQLERAVEDVEAAVELSQARSVSAEIERREEVQEALASLRRTLSADLRGQLAASWKAPTERARVAQALGATRPADEDLGQRVLSGTIRTNTVEQMRSRSLRRSQDIMSSIRKTLALVFVALTLAAAFAPSAEAATPGKKGGEQTGGK